MVKFVCGEPVALSDSKSNTLTYKQCLCVELEVVVIAGIIS